jgi:TRAP-type uncharacterized transport system fused permease subunit
MRVRCPFCGKEFDELSAIPGSVVICPFCLKQARLLGQPPVKTGLEQKPIDIEEKYVPPGPTYPPTKKGFSTSAVGVILIVGVVIFFVGAILCNSAVITKSYSSSDYDSYEDYQKATKETRENARLTYKIGTIIADIGALIACVGIFAGALLCTKIELALRIALLSVGTAIIVVTLILMLLGAPFGMWVGMPTGM